MLCHRSMNRNFGVLQISAALILLAASAAPAGAAVSDLVESYTPIYTFGIDQGRPYTSMSINMSNQVVFADSTFGIFQGSNVGNTVNLWSKYWGSGSANGKYSNNAINPANNESGQVMVSGMTYISDSSASVRDGSNTYALSAGLKMSGAMIKAPGGATTVLYPTYVPGYDGGHANSAYSLYTARGLTNDGYISFTGGYNGNSNHGVFYGTGSTTVTVATDTAGQFAGNLDNSPVYANNTFNTLAITGDGATKKVLFRGSLSTGGASEGLYVGDGTTITAIATTTGGQFKGFANAGLYPGVGSYSGASAIDKKGDVAYRAVLADGREALYYYDAALGTSTQLVVSDGATFNRIYSVSLNNNGLIAIATAMNGVSNTLWMFDLSDTSKGLQRLLGTGDAFDGHVIGNPVNPGFDIQLADSAYNDLNELAVGITYTELLGNGQSLAVVYALDPSPAVPEPATMALLALGGVFALRRRSA